MQVQKARHVAELFVMKLNEAYGDRGIVLVNFVFCPNTEKKLQKVS